MSIDYTATIRSGKNEWVLTSGSRDKDQKQNRSQNSKETMSPRQREKMNSKKLGGAETRGTKVSSNISTSFVKGLFHLQKLCPDGKINVSGKRGIKRENGSIPKVFKALL